MSNRSEKAVDLLPFHGQESDRPVRIAAMSEGRSICAAHARFLPARREGEKTARRTMIDRMKLNTARRDRSARAPRAAHHASSGAARSGRARRWPPPSLPLACNRHRRKLHIAAEGQRRDLASAYRGGSVRVNSKPGRSRRETPRRGCRPAADDVVTIFWIATMIDSGPRRRRQGFEGKVRRTGGMKFHKLGRLHLRDLGPVQSDGQSGHVCSTSVEVDMGK